MNITNRQYFRDGYHGRVYISQTDPAQDPDVTVKDGDEWHIPGSTHSYIRYGGEWYKAEIYGPPESRPSSGIPGQKFIEVLPDGKLGQMYIVPPNGGSFVLFQPQHPLNPQDGVHTGKLPISMVTGHTRNNPVHVQIRLEAVLMAQTGAARASSTMI